jgi:plastocyanin
VEAVNVGGLYGESHHWSPAQVTVVAGGVVTLSNPTETLHGVEWVGGPDKPTCEEGAGKVPVGTTAAASASKWSGTCTFSQAGAYRFYCTVHGPEMTGTVTVSTTGTTTVTTQTTPTVPTTPTTTTPTEIPSGSPFVGGLSLRASQHGGSVHGVLGISQTGAGGRLEIDLLANSASLASRKHTVSVRVGRLVRNSVSAGRKSFAVALTATARHALKRKHRLSLTVKITLVPPAGKAATLTRSVVERP